MLYSDLVKVYDLLKNKKIPTFDDSEVKKEIALIYQKLNMKCPT